jgi:DNA-binding MarR family transcriptional regulator
VTDGHEVSLDVARDDYARRILAEIEAGRGASQRSLARSAGIALGLTNLVLRKLVRKGWVERWIDKGDRRQTLVRLTVAGRDVLADSRAHLVELLDQRLAVMSATERDALAAQLHRVREVLSPSEEET